MNLSRIELSSEVMEAWEEGRDLEEAGVKVVAQRIIKQLRHDRKIRHARS